MKNFIKLTIVATVLLSLSAANLFGKQIKKQFSGQTEIKIKLVLGSCSIDKSPDENIYVQVDYSFDDEIYTTIFRDKGKKLYLKESFKDHDNNGDGRSAWSLKIPDGMEVDFESATGDLNVVNVSKIKLDGSSGTGSIVVQNSQGELELNSGTGDVELKDCQGEIELNSGTGDVNLEDSRGSFDLNSGTGDVYAAKITIEDQAEVNSGTGEAEVKGPTGKDYELSISSGTDDAILDMDGQAIEGYFELKAQKRRGSIISPITFDNEEDIGNDNGGSIKKSFTRGKATPQYYISTGTGKAKLIK